MNTSKKSPVAVLIGGGPRTGTTLLVDILNENKNIGILSEYVLDDLIRTLEPLLKREKLIGSMTIGPGIIQKKTQDEYSDEKSDFSASTIVGGDANDLCAYTTVETEQSNDSSFEQSGEKDVILSRDRLSSSEHISGPLVEPSSQQTSIQFVLSDDQSSHGASRFEFTRNVSLTYPLRYPQRDTFPVIVEGVVAASLGKQQLSVIGAKDPFFTLHHDASYVAATLNVPIKYILLLRNPIEQINSSINRRNIAMAGDDIWHIKTVSDAIYEYRSMFLINYSYFIHFGSDVLFVKYDDLLLDTKSTLRMIYRFLDLQGPVSQGNVRIAKTSRSIMTDDEQLSVSAAFPLVAETWPLSRSINNPDVDSLFDGLVEQYPCPFAVEFSSNVPGRPLLGLGWRHNFGRDGARSRAIDCYLVFAIKDAGVTRIQLRLAPVFAPEQARLVCRVSVNGRITGRIEWRRESDDCGTIPIAPAANDPTLVLTGSGERDVEIACMDLPSGKPIAVRLHFEQDERPPRDKGRDTSANGGVTVKRFAIYPET